MDLLGATPQRGRDAAPAWWFARPGLPERTPDSRANRQRSADFRRRQGRRGLRQEAGRRTLRRCARPANYYELRQEDPGRAVRDILAESLPRAILGIQWPKTMYWTGGKTGPRFIRPIRWIVALLGDQVIPFEIARREERQHHARPSQSGLGIDPGDHRQLRERAAQELRDPVCRRAPPQDREGSRRAGREDRCRSARDADLHHRISPPRSAAISIRPIWNCPPKC